MELSASTKKLIKKHAVWLRQQKPEEGEPTVHVDEVASKVAAFYEQIRTIVDWKEEHLMRRSAIIRKLKRRFLNLEISNFSDAENIAEPLVLELIRGGHFPNDKIAESKIKDVHKIINKYVFILRNNPENKSGKSSLQFYNWLLEIAACEIEDALVANIKEKALIDYMFENMEERIRVQEDIYKRGFLAEKEKDIQIYIAVQQALLKLDKPIISYNLIRYKYPQWKEADKNFIAETSQNIYEIWRGVEKDLLHPLAKKFYTVCEKYDTPYLLMGDVLFEKQSATGQESQIQEPSVLEGLIRSSYKKRHASLKARILRASIYSTISIFLTKILSLLFLEVLLSRILTGHLDFATLAADVLIPTALMFILVANVKLPSEKNLNLVIIEAMKIVYQKEQTDIYDIKIQKKRGVITRVLISFIYAISALISFGLIYLVLNFFGFPVTSILINIVFIALILFAGTAVKKRAQELTIEDEPEGFFCFFSDIFFLPVQGLGRWMSNKWKKYNAISAFFNAMIDMPFSVFVEFLERWRYFIKERKEEIR